MYLKKMIHFHYNLSCALAYWGKMPFQFRDQYFIANISLFLPFKKFGLQTLVS
ncbi:hypothetical protein M079_2380 [Bacteroides fragilis str. 3996 N(B) 6]|uniref:Uncharacterized protein n=1 Tax=Bacteroides fragilis str. 3998T(B)3 TaxID=1339316 RepID=A0A015V506_BACFG|nr:hypothetical protein M079_2380 [Bacteroides fragilis str. 3996 N(B) 6]EXY90491.1 hypothetical protein M125_2811 [Bacteroides fragilis str. 3998T(B)3]EXY95364.1 hypothetical protein M081_2460 [Bacteroides fragilis str. 3998 T(B) 4]